MALFEEAKDLVGICGALDATAEVLMAEGEATKAAELLKEAARKAKQTQMKVPPWRHGAGKGEIGWEPGNGGRKGEIGWVGWGLFLLGQEVLVW